MPSGFKRIADSSEKLSEKIDLMHDSMKLLSENTKNLTEETKKLRETMEELIHSFNTALKELGESMAMIAQFTQYLQHPSKSVIEGMGDNVSRIFSSFIPKKEK